MAQELRRTVPGGRVESSTINAVGVWFYAKKTDSYLYLMRADDKHAGTWGLPGGKVDPNETLLDTIERECNEELGAMPIVVKLVPIEKFTSPDAHFCYHTFFCYLEEEFHPCLNHEHLGYTWIKRGTLPKPLHPGLWATVNLQQVLDKIETARQLYTSHCETKVG